MKFLAFALAPLVGFADAAPITGKKLKTRMEKGQFNKQSLMRKAQPYSATAKQRHAEENQWEINGLYSVSFNSCTSLTVQSEDLFDEDMLYYAQNGQVVAEKSYILFDVCYTQDCYYQAQNAKMTYVTDIGSFFEAFSSYLPNQVETYCEACEENEDYCMGNLDGQQYNYNNGYNNQYNNNNADGGDENNNNNGGDNYNYNNNNNNNNGGDNYNNNNNNNYNNNNNNNNNGGDNNNNNYNNYNNNNNNNNNQAQNNGGNYNYNNNNYQDNNYNNDYNNNYQNNNNNGGNRKLNDDNAQVEYIDCNLCSEYECFVENDDDGYQFEDAIEWLNDISECQEVENYYFDGNLAQYLGLICNADGTGVEIAVFLDEDCSLYTPNQAFGNIMSDSDYTYYQMAKDVVEYMFTNDFSCYNPEIEYTNPYEEAEQDQDDNGDGDGDGDDQGDDAYEVPEAAEWCEELFNGEMEATNLYDCGYNNNNNNNGDNNNGDDDYDENLYYYNWYSYQLTEEQAEDEYEVCQMIKSFNGEYTPTVYNKQGSGGMFNYKKQNNGEEILHSAAADNSIDVGVIAGIVLLVVVAAGVLVALCCRAKKVNVKEEPLVSQGEWTMT